MRTVTHRATGNEVAVASGSPSVGDIKVGSVVQMCFKEECLYFSVRCVNCKWRKTVERGGPKGIEITKAIQDGLAQKCAEHWKRMHA